jgi:hypothetical protein
VTAPTPVEKAPPASTPAPTTPEAPVTASPGSHAHAPTTATTTTTTIQPTSYFVPSGDVEHDQQVPGFAWLRRVVGVNYYLPRRMTADLHGRFQSFEAAQGLFGDWGGEWIERPGGGRAFRLNWIDQASFLSYWLGLRPGDVVLFVNHEPIGAAAEDARALHERLKTGRRFAVLVERNEKPIVISFFVE